MSLYRRNTITDIVIGSKAYHLNYDGHIVDRFGRKLFEDHVSDAILTHCKLNGWTGKQLKDVAETINSSLTKEKQNE
jgi:hypothetical protein